MAKCEQCGNAATDLGWDGMTAWDSVVIRKGTGGGHPAHLALLGLSLVARRLFSTVYYCRHCNIKWREWFE